MLDYTIKENALLNKVILVTGAGDGIGRQAAISYAEQGASVILLGKTVSKLEAVYDEIINAGYPEPAIIPLDLKGATEQHYIDMATTIEQQYQRLDGLLHNAGILTVLSPFEQIEQDSFDDVMQVNVKAPFLMTKALLPLMKKTSNSSIVFTSSGVGKKGRAYWGSYAISKFATEGMMETLSDELENTSVRVNAINPGATQTNMRARAYPGEDATLLKTPKQIIAPWLFLMADESADVTGQSIDAQPK
ncbi:YciK family oxidoreductase [Psychrobium sp. 1_MG-2023]|uniref:YciK family oxidoreductase n=1 Tax=Psychrobium sp. 1_MG-2023 TaxID=3062624 RepID=UPI000C33FD6C|nr:YciK family oxidoreductase [Psychrobium sp. 1_MG-2023]MDP2560216.1 YciK family oxidoreductase [Psychrobium sp. 1_MG-2023]PKF57027.1 YciK family oxidoreductase [Alteromonadales bacterium alter-6D02]